MLPRVIAEVEGSVLLVQPSFLRLYDCRCVSALSVIICRTSVKVGLKVICGGKEVMVISPPIVVEVQPCDVRGGVAGCGLKERLKV